MTQEKRTHDQEFFDSLTAEEMQTTTDQRGFPVIEWVKRRERNEAGTVFAMSLQWRSSPVCFMTKATT